MGTPLWVTVSFSLAVFKLLSLSLIFGDLIIMSLGVCFLGSNLFGTLSFLEFYVLFPSPDWGSFHCYFSNKVSISCSCSSPPGTPMIWALECLKLSHRVLSLPSFFSFLVSSFCSRLLIWVLVSFPTLLVPCICFFISFLHSLQFFLYFVYVHNYFCEYPDYQCFDLCIW